MARCCHTDCAAPAPYGFRVRGVMRSLPVAIRGKYLWACADHRDEAAARVARYEREHMMTGAEQEELPL